MAKGLFEKAGRIQLPVQKPAVDNTAAAVPPPALGAKSKTAPGTLLGFMANQSEAIRENEVLREQAAKFDGASPTRLLDPASIRPSAWANRHAATFETAEFADLREEISRAGGNVQPIKVRPLLADGGGSDGGVGPSNPPAEKYEIVFGHRRHRACLELGIPVLAMVEPITEQELFVEMERENRGRADLSAWEQGMMYARALDSGLYPSNRQLAGAIGRDLSDVGRAISLARLPASVVEAFASPLELQFRWAKPLNDVLQSNPDVLIARAKAAKGRSLTAKQVYAQLLGVEADEGVGPSYPTEKVMRNGKLYATVLTDAVGRVTVKYAGVMEASERQALLASLRNR